MHNRHTPACPARQHRPVRVCQERVVSVEPPQQRVVAADVGHEEGPAEQHDVAAEQLVPHRNVLEVEVGGDGPEEAVQEVRGAEVHPQLLLDVIDPFCPRTG